MSPRLIDTLQMPLTDPVLFHCVDSVIQQTEVRDFRKPQIGFYEEVRRLTTKQLDGCACAHGALARCVLQCILKLTLIPCLRPPDVSRPDSIFYL